MKGLVPRLAFALVAVVTLLPAFEGSFGSGSSDKDSKQRRSGECNCQTMIHGCSFLLEKRFVSRLTNHLCAILS
jgi:hypothetical protein